MLMLLGEFASEGYFFEYFTGALLILFTLNLWMYFSFKVRLQVFPSGYFLALMLTEIILILIWQQASLPLVDASGLGFVVCIMIWLLTLYNLQLFKVSFNTDRFLYFGSVGLIVMAPITLLADTNSTEWNYFSMLLVYFGLMMILWCVRTLQIVASREMAQSRLYWINLTLLSSNFLLVLFILGVLAEERVFIVGYLLITSMSFVLFQSSIFSQIRETPSQMSLLNRRNQMLEEQLVRCQKVQITLDELLAMLRHELKTPLSVIRMALTLKQPSEKVKNYASQSVEEMARVIDECCYSQKVDQELLVLKKVEFDLAKYLSQVIQAEEGLKQRVVLIGFEQEIIVFNDVKYIDQIVKTLLDNALSYSPEGSEVRIAVGQDVQKNAWFTIANDLVASSQFNREKLFARYYREPSSQQKTGAGLGLFIANRIAKELGLQLDAEVLHGQVRFIVEFNKGKNVELVDS